MLRLLYAIAIISLAKTDFSKQSYIFYKSMRVASTIMDYTPNGNSWSDEDAQTVSALESNTMISYLRNTGCLVY